MAIHSGKFNPAKHPETAPGARIAGRAQVSGMNGRGVVHLAGAVGMLGTPRQQQAASDPASEDSLDMRLQGKRGGPPAGPHRAGQ